MEGTRSRHADAPPRCRSGGISLGMKGPERARDVLAFSWAATVCGETLSGGGVSFGQIGRFALDKCFFAVLLAKNYSSEIPVRPQLHRAVRSPLPPPPACAAVGETSANLLRALATTGDPPGTGLLAVPDSPSPRGGGGLPRVLRQDTVMK